MTWATQRKLIYALVVLVFMGALVLYSARDILFPVPTCFDTKKNGDEAGVDCDGSCNLRCIANVQALSVVWSSAIKTGPHMYDVVAMVSNKNISSAPHVVAYTFTLMSKSGDVLATLNGTSPVLLQSDFPVIQQNIPLQEDPARVIVRLVPAPMYAVAQQSTASPIRVTSTQYEPGDTPRIYVTLANTTRTVFMKLPLRMVAYDANDNAIAVGESIIPVLGKEEIQNVPFTWNQYLSSYPVKIRAYPIIDPFTGSH
jgi:hypothetical protein